MPIIAEQTITIDVLEDNKIKILLRDKFKDNNCIHLASLSSNKDDMDKIRDVARQLVGEKAIECDKDTCCISNNYFDFVKKLGGLK